MAGQIATTITFSNLQQVSSSKLNEIISGAYFTEEAVDGTTLLVSIGKLRVGTITVSEMGVDSVTTLALTDGSVTTPKIADNSITAAKYANLSITGAKIAAGTIDFSNLSTAAAATKAAMQGEAAGFVVTPDIEKHHPGIAKAYGEFDISSSSRTIKANSRNVASLARITTQQTSVAFTSNMDSANYTVLVHGVSSSESVFSSVYDKTASGFKIFHVAEAAGRGLNFVVFGKYA